MLLKSMRVCVCLCLLFKDGRYAVIRFCLNDQAMRMLEAKLIWPLESFNMLTYVFSVYTHLANNYSN